MKQAFNLQPSNLYDDGENLWFTAYSYGALYRMRKEDKLTECMVTFDSMEKVTEIRLYADIVEWNDSLVLTPLRASNIAIVNKCTFEVKYISIDVEGNDFLDGYTGWNYYSSVIYGDFAYFFPHQRTAVLKLNLNNNSLEIMKSWTEEIAYDLIYPRLYSKIKRIDNMIYAPLSGTNKLQIIDIDKNSYRIIESAEKNATYSDVYVLQNNAILSPLEGGNIVCINIEDGKQMLIPVHNPISHGIHFLGIVRCGNNLLFIPEYHGNIAVLDINTFKLWDDDNIFEEKLKNLPQKYINESKYMDYFERVGETYLYCNHKGVLVRIHDEGTEVEEITAVLSDELCISILKSIHQSNNVAEENEMITVDEFINMIHISE